MQISVFIKVLILKFWTEIRPTIVNFKNYAFVCPNESFKLKVKTHIDTSLCYKIY